MSTESDEAVLSHLHSHLSFSDKKNSTTAAGQIRSMYTLFSLHKIHHWPASFSIRHDVAHNHLSRFVFVFVLVTSNILY